MEYYFNPNLGSRMLHKAFCRHVKKWSVIKKWRKLSEREALSYIRSGTNKCADCF